MEKKRFIDRESPEYNNMRFSLALDFCPPISPCHDCGAPTVHGYCCTRCGSVDPMSGEDSDDA